MQGGATSLATLVVQMYEAHTFGRSIQHVRPLTGGVTHRPFLWRLPKPTHHAATGHRCRLWSPIGVAPGRDPNPSRGMTLAYQSYQGSPGGCNGQERGGERSHYLLPSRYRGNVGPPGLIWTVRRRGHLMGGPGAFGAFPPPTRDHAGSRFRQTVDHRVRGGPPDMSDPRTLFGNEEWP